VSPRVPDPATATRMHATAAALTTAGLAAQVNQTQGVLDITASLSQPDGKSIEVIVDRGQIRPDQLLDQPRCYPGPDRSHYRRCAGRDRHQGMTVA